MTQVAEHDETAEEKRAKQNKAHETATHKELLSHSSASDHRSLDAVRQVPVKYDNV